MAVESGQSTTTTNAASTEEPKESAPGISRFATSGDISDLWVGAIVVFMMFGSLIFFAWSYENGTHFNLCLLSGVLGAALGWTVGIIISPYSITEREAFASIGKLVYGFLSGYAFSKIDPIIGSLIDPKTATPTVAIYVTVALVSFLASAAFTYISRSYWRGDTK